MLAGMILAGGKSSRMGEDKSLLTLPDSQLSLLEYNKKKLTLICGDKVFISGGVHQNGIADIIANCGPISGIHAVTTHIQTRHKDVTELLVVAVDMPDVQFEDLQYLLKVGRKRQKLCCFIDCYLPLYIQLSSDVIDYLNATLTSKFAKTDGQQKKPQYSIKNMLNLLQGKQIPALEKSRLGNINTVAQWQQHCATPPLNKV